MEGITGVSVRLLSLQTTAEGGTGVHHTPCGWTVRESLTVVADPIPLRHRPCVASSFPLYSPRAVGKQRGLKRGLPRVAGAKIPQLAYFENVGGGAR